jgi:iron-sulfur cluster repair protein YtfE (RIC family)
MIDRVDAKPETEQGKALFDELLWVHSILRRDLDSVERLAREVAAGMSGADLESELRELKTAGPLWQLKASCLRYCRFVHMHHNAEDVLLFPALREADPSIAPVVDRLEADHLRVSDLLDAIEAAAVELTANGSGDACGRVVLGLEELHGHLLEHLDYEELQAGPVMRRLERLPGF